jgi:hypothetical protein
MKSIGALLLWGVLTSALYAVPPPPEDPFDPALVVWDPGTIQTWNPPAGGRPGFWSIQLDSRSITQADIPTLSPLEVQEAVEVLTSRKYPIEFVLNHLEQFRQLITVDPRG